MSRRPREGQQCSSASFGPAQAIGTLPDAGQQQIGDYLQEEHRYAESIPIFEPLVKWKPDNMDWRVRLMRAYHESHRPEQLNELVSQTEKYFHADGRWTADNIAQLADACLDCDLDKRSAGYFNEAISARQRANPGGSLGDATLSGWYESLASAQSALGHTQEAVDAASAAIVCWSPHQSQRADAINRLKTVLSSAKDLDAYVNHLDEEAKKTGQDSPLLRKTIGQVYQVRNRVTQAIAQFDLARQLQPNDTETYQALIACYDALGQTSNASKQLLALVDCDRHDLRLYEQLADRMKSDEAEAERAATSIIEAGPSEAENHQALAELRQKQNRWDDAIDQWKEVAELRRLEPTGLLKLVEAEIHQKQWAPARQTLDKLNKTEWPSRFNDVGNQIQRLRSMLSK
jgi:tetratricopeptide (TPR) repeat protein